MPLLTAHQLAAGQITERTIDLRAHYAAAAGKLNDITGLLLALANDDLASFGNMLGPLEMQTLLTVHADQGSTLNAQLAGVDAVLASVGIHPPTTVVDVSPFADKLAAQRREIIAAAGIFTVVDFPPEPEPEQEPVAEATLEPAQ